MEHAKAGGRVFPVRMDEVVGFVCLCVALLSVPAVADHPTVLVRLDREPLFL